jgi:hypothetical protein
MAKGASDDPNKRSTAVPSRSQSGGRRNSARIWARRRLDRTLGQPAVLEHAALHAVLASLRDVDDPLALFARHAGAQPESALVTSLVPRVGWADLPLDLLNWAFLLRWNERQDRPGGRGGRLGNPYGSSEKTCPVRSVQASLEAAPITERAVFRSVDRFQPCSRGASPTSQWRALLKGGLRPSDLTPIGTRATRSEPGSRLAPRPAAPPSATS